MRNSHFGRGSNLNKQRPFQFLHLAKCMNPKAIAFRVNAFHPIFQDVNFLKTQPVGPGDALHDANIPRKADFACEANMYPGNFDPAMLPLLLICF
jgi:hypothetical protein